MYEPLSIKEREPDVDDDRKFKNSPWGPRPIGCTSLEFVAKSTKNVAFWLDSRGLSAIFDGISPLFLRRKSKGSNSTDITDFTLRREITDRQ